MNILRFSEGKVGAWILFGEKDVSKYAIMISHGEEKQRRFHAMNLPTDVPILHSYA